MKEFLQAMKEWLVWIAKSISEDKMDEAVESIQNLSKTLDETKEQIKKNDDTPSEEEPTTDDPSTEGGDEWGDAGDDPSTDDPQEVEKTVEKVVNQKLEKFADMYLSASDAKQLFQDFLEAVKGLTEVTKTIKEQVWSVEERVEKIENAKPSKQLDKTDDSDDKPKWVSKILGWDVLNPRAYANQ